MTFKHQPKFQKNLSFENIFLSKNGLTE